MQSEITGYRDDLPRELKRILREIVYWDVYADQADSAAKRRHAFTNKTEVIRLGLEAFPDNWWIYFRDGLYHFVSFAAYPNSAAHWNRIVVHVPSYELRSGRPLSASVSIICAKIAATENRSLFLTAKDARLWPDNPPAVFSRQELIAELIKTAQSS